MEVFYKKVNELTEYENNARQNDAGVEKIAESIKRFGFLNPIVIDDKGVIISGHARLKAAKLLQLEEVPCIVSDLPEEEARLARIVDNKSHEYATWDIGKLGNELDMVKSDFKHVFFAPSRDRRFFAENKTFAFGNTQMPITEKEYKRLKALYDNYLKAHKTYMGFVEYLIGVTE